MLWDLIRDFFVQNVFGGYLSDGSAVSGFIGHIDIFDNGSPIDNTDIFTSDFLVKIGFVASGYEDTSSYYISIGDYLSTIATIISISIIVVLCCLFIYKIIKLIGGLIR